MAIVKMKQFHLLALNSDKKELLRRLQIFRNVDFSDLDSEYEDLKDIDIHKSLGEIDEFINRCKFCIDYFDRYYPKATGIKALKEGVANITFHELEEAIEKIDFDNVYDKIRLNADSMDGVRYDLNKAREEKEDLNVYRNLDVIPSQMDKLSHTTYYIGSIAIVSRNEFEKALNDCETCYFEQLGVRKTEAVYLLVFHNDEKSLIDEIIKSKGFAKTNLNLDMSVIDRISNLSKEVDVLVERKKELRKGLKELIPYRKDIELYYEYAQNIRLRILANQKSKSTEKVCVFTGYFPASQQEEFCSIVNEVTGGANSLEIIDADRDDENVPIMLKNNKVVSVFEPITQTYSMPRYNEMDPTPFIVPFYTIFFGMMSADAGYGTLMLILSLIAIKFFNLSPDMKRTVKFFSLLSIFTLLWGVVYNSYFGVKLSFMPQIIDMSSQVQLILIISMIFGVIHLFTGLALKAYLYFREGNIIRGIFCVISWYVALIASGLLLLGGQVFGFSDTTLQILKWIMIIGFMMIIIGGMLECEGKFGAKIGAGLYNLYGITSYIGDIVSYSRLLALGLAGAYIALAVNTIAKLLFGNIIGIIAGVIILVVFHAFNIFLSYLGAYVHGMRLIYVEFFGKFYEGGGKAFKFFRSKSKYINLDRHLEE